MKYKIKYHEKVVSEDIKSLWNKEKNIIKSAIEDKLSSRPEIFWLRLRKSLKWYLKLRVWNYRVIFKINNNSIKIFAIKHRSVVYEKFNKRI